jgi:hypothetical protein
VTTSTASGRGGRRGLVAYGADLLDLAVDLDEVEVLREGQGPRVLDHGPQLGWTERSAVLGEHKQQSCAYALAAVGRQHPRGGEGTAGGVGAIADAGAEDGAVRDGEQQQSVG